MRRRSFAGVVGLVLLLGSALPANAAPPPPSVTMTLTCERGAGFVSAFVYVGGLTVYLECGSNLNEPARSDRLRVETTAEVAGWGIWGQGIAAQCYDYSDVPLPFRVGCETTTGTAKLAVR